MLYIPVIFLIILCSFSENLVNAASDSNNIQTRCSGNATIFSSLSYQTFQHNVISLTSKLTSESSPSTPPPIFYNASVGNSPYKAYGYYLCRGDLSPRLCHDCVSEADKAFINQIQTGPGYFYPECFAFSDRCMLRYANLSISSTYEVGRVLYSSPIGAKASNLKLYNDTLSNTIEDLIKEAARGDWLQGFITMVADVPGSNKDKIYVLGQCVPSISAQNCSKCLGELYSQIPTCCSGTQGGVVIHANCMLKFDSQSFFGASSHGFSIGLFQILMVVFSVLYFL